MDGYRFGTQHTIGVVFIDSFPAIGTALGQTSLFIRETLPGQATGDYQDQRAAEYRSRRIPYHFGYQPASQYERAMVAERNRKWMVTLLPMITKEPAFIAVGLDHLMTAEGLVALLRKAGYKVTNIPL